MAATAVRFLVLGAATDATYTKPTGDIVELAAAGPEGRCADTIEPPSFTMALDCLIRGLESELRTVDSGTTAARRRRARRAAA